MNVNYAESLRGLAMERDVTMVLSARREFLEFQKFERCLDFARHDTNGSVVFGLRDR